MAHKVTWILVSDASRARVYENEGGGGEFKDVLGRDFIHDNRPSRGIASDKPGRSFDSSGQGRHSMEQANDPHSFERFVFARELAQMLEEHRKEQDFDQLVIVAPPKMLGDLRAAFTRGVEALIAGEINKDLTKVPIHELPAHLSEIIRF